MTSEWSTDQDKLIHLMVGQHAFNDISDARSSGSEEISFILYVNGWNLGSNVHRTVRPC